MHPHPRTGAAPAHGPRPGPYTGTRAPAPAAPSARRRDADFRLKCLVLRQKMASRWENAGGGGRARGRARGNARERARAREGTRVRGGERACAAGRRRGGGGTRGEARKAGRDWDAVQAFTALAHGARPHHRDHRRSQTSIRRHPGLTRVNPRRLRSRDYRPTARTVSPEGMCRTRQLHRLPRDRGSPLGSRE